MENNKLSYLKQYWGYDGFRGVQEDIIDSILAQHDTLGLMPTGGGKSITFQIPALMQDGVCVVITPLIALMKDQVQSLKNKGILASAIYTGMTRNEIIKTLDNTIYGSTKLLYISPERLASDLFQSKLIHMNVSFIAVDEAHCISQWGYDFRPSYLEISHIRKLLPNTPILALTATATEKVVEDIKTQLNFSNSNFFKMSFKRENLAYVVRYSVDKYGEIIHILNSVSGAAIVYVRSRQKTKEISDLLNNNNISATFYHAGLENAIRDERQMQWQEGKTRVMVATNAFGMGIDKANVRVVIHLNSPNSIEEYFQEAGRAGRDMQKSYAVLLYNNSDKSKLLRRVEDAFPPKEKIYEIYNHICYFLEIGMGSGKGSCFYFDIDTFCSTFKHYPTQVESSLYLLQQAGYIEYNADPNENTRVMFILDRDDLYKIKDTTPKEEQVITTMLRTYSGMFTNLISINELYIARKTQLTQSQLYVVLKSLRRKGLIQFIPPKNIPKLTFITRRIDDSNIIIPKNIYEERKSQCNERITAMINYAENNTVCRSKQLLTYFNDIQNSECGKCDVCLDANKTSVVAAQNVEVYDAIINTLKDKKQHHITEINALNYPKQHIHNTIKQLVAEEQVYVDTCYISLKT